MVVQGNVEQFLSSESRCSLSLGLRTMRKLVISEGVQTDRLSGTPLRSPDDLRRDFPPLRLALFRTQGLS